MIRALAALSAYKMKDTSRVIDEGLHLPGSMGATSARTITTEACTVRRRARGGCLREAVIPGPSHGLGNAPVSGDGFEVASCPGCLFTWTVTTSRARRPQT
jgi:hypothetical protein